MEYNILSMIEHQLAARGIKDQNVLQAMQEVPRDLFVPKNLKELAYTDSPLPIGYNQTISQPYIVAMMTEAAQLTKEDKVLEIGTGSGYQAAILGKICNKVYSLEVIQPLAEGAIKIIDKLGYDNISIKIDNGYQGWEEKQPFNAIIVTAAAKHLPQNLVNQLEVDGKLIIPIEKENGAQYLMRYTNKQEGLVEEVLLQVRFVPMVE